MTAAKDTLPPGPVAENGSAKARPQNGSGPALSSLRQARQAHVAGGFGTLAVHAGAPHDAATGAVIEAISLSTTFEQHGAGDPIGDYEYSRAGNPNRRNFEAAVASLEGAKHALAFSSGSATTAVILQSLALGSHVVSVSDVYGGTHRYFTQVAKAHGVRVTFTPAIEADIAVHIQPETRLVWIETPSNPTLRLVDIEKVAAAAHARGVLVVVDNTFLSPYVQNPLAHGADIVVHSVTKYINGHSDVVMGAAAFDSDELRARLAFLQNAIGAVPSPFDCWLAHRGLKTLHLRAREATRNATAAERFCRLTRVFTLAESLGGVESLAEVPSVMTHAGIPRAEREAAGVFDDLVRLSCGVEDADDLVRDVLQALERAVADEGADTAPTPDSPSFAGSSDGMAA